MSIGNLTSRLTVIVACLACLCAGPALPDAVIYVDDDAPPGGDGQTWATAFRFLQHALTAATTHVTPAVEIRIAGGTYVPGQTEDKAQPAPNRHASFALGDSMTVCGGYAGCGAPDPNERDIDLYETIFSGDLEGDDEPEFAHRSDNVYHVVTAITPKGSMVLDGVTIRGGHTDAEIVLGFQFNRLGAAVFAQGGPAVLQDCLICDNSAVSGGAVCAWESQLQVIRCTLLENHGGNGGAMKVGFCSPSVFSCVFQDNEAATGAGIDCYQGELHISECLFLGNHVKYEGGAIGNWMSSVAIILDSTFIENSAGSFGGAIDDFAFTESLYSRCVFTGNIADEGGAAYAIDAACEYVDCLFSANSARNGGAIFNFVIDAWESRTFINCLFTENTAEDVGGAVYTLSDGTVTLTNCTLAQNSAGSGGALLTGWGQPIVTNCILWDNHATSGSHEIAGAAAVSYSIVKGWPGGGNHVFDADPLFVDSVYGDYRLLPASPCIDAGNNSIVPDDVLEDLDGLPRLLDNPLVDDTGLGEPPIVDIGVYEFNVGDIDHDGGVDVIDLLDLLSQWGECDGESSCSADFNQDGSVDVLDLLILLGEWSPRGIVGFDIAGKGMSGL